MRILVTFAVTAEFAPWRAHHRFVPYEFDPLGHRREFDLFKADIELNEVTVLLTGMGKENARKAMQSVPLETQDLCISTGLAGALEVAWKAGEIVVARTVKAPGETVHATTDTDLVKLAITAGAVEVDAFLSMPSIVSSAIEKQDLSASANVVEMESAHILSVAAQRRLPVVAVRAISDEADEDLPINFERIADSRGHVRFGLLVKELMVRPYQLVPLLRFGRQSHAAAESLAAFLDRYIPAITKNWDKIDGCKRQEVSAI